MQLGDKRITASKLQKECPQVLLDLRLRDQFPFGAPFGIRWCNSVFGVSITVFAANNCRFCLFQQYKPVNMC